MRSDRIPAGNAWAAYTTLNRTYRRIAVETAPPPTTSATRSRRNAYEKSANEKRAAIPMNRTRGRGTPRSVTRRRSVGRGSRACRGAGLAGRLPEEEDDGERDNRREGGDEDDQAVRGSDLRACAGGHEGREEGQGDEGADDRPRRVHAAVEPER